jgi:hypothetical protein
MWIGPQGELENYGKSIIHPVNINIRKYHNTFNYDMISLTYLAALA